MIIDFILLLWAGAGLWAQAQAYKRFTNNLNDPFEKRWLVFVMCIMLIPCMIFGPVGFWVNNESGVYDGNQK